MCKRKLCVKCVWLIQAQASTSLCFLWAKRRSQPQHRLHLMEFIMHLCPSGMIEGTALTLNLKSLKGILIEQCQNGSHFYHFIITCGRGKETNRKLTVKQMGFWRLYRKSIHVLKLRLRVRLWPWTIPWIICIRMTLETSNQLLCSLILMCGRR